MRPSLMLVLGVDLFAGTACSPAGARGQPESDDRERAFVLDPLPEASLIAKLTDPCMEIIVDALAVNGTGAFITRLASPPRAIVVKAVASGTSGGMPG